MINKKFIITGGGSGGHVSAASAIIYALIEEYGVDPKDITYIGGDLGMVGEETGNSLEQRRFKDVPFNTQFIRAGKLQRTFSLSSIKLFLRTFLGFKDAFSFVLKSKADAVISTGGFVSVPVCIWARLLGKPVFLHEQTASVGLSNKIVGNFSKTIYTSFEDSKKYFKRKRVLHVGNTVRKAILNRTATAVSKEILNFLEKEPNIPLIYVSGGGLGSHLINEKFLEQISSVLSKYRVILQMGENQIYNDYKKALDIKESLSADISKRFFPTKYIEDNDIGYIYDQMGIFLGRSGANTVYEIGVVEKPAIFIPIPWVTHNEQYLNAKVLEDFGLAKIISEKDFRDVNILEEVDRFLEQMQMRNIDLKKLEDMFPVNATYKMLEDIFPQL